MAPFDFAKRNGAQTLLFSQPHIFRKKSFQPNENSRLRSNLIRRFKIKTVPAEIKNFGIEEPVLIKIRPFD